MNFIGYEYKEMVVDSKKASMYMDGYRNFGWEMDENQKELKEAGMVPLRLKRDRKIMNKAELTRLQRNFEDCMNQIDKLERSVYGTARMRAFTAGLVGTIFIAGATFAVTAAPPVIWLCVLLAVPGFAGWISPWFIYRDTVRKRVRLVSPLIEDKQDEIYEICEKGNQLSGNI